jgi:tRNA/rRNA methyltransferase
VSSPSRSIDRTRIRIVLVRARNPGNIGAVARAMHDFGFHDLHVVNEFAIPFEAAKSAIDASDVLESATLSATVAEAVAGCTLVIGTTAVGERDLRHPLLGLADASVRIRSEAAGEGRVALLFGSEKTGLSNEDLSFCDLLLTIPMEEYEGIRHPSMNLGQAVAVCLWELVRPGVAPEGVKVQAADAAEIERLMALLYEVLDETEYTRRHAASASMEQVRRRLHRMRLETEDIPVWMGILRQILWKIRTPSGTSKS